MRAYTRGIHRARTDREFTYKSLAKYTKIQDQVVLQKAYDFYMSKVLEKAPYVNMAGVHQRLRTISPKRCPRRKTPSLSSSSICVFSIRLRRAGLLKELYP